MNKQFDYNNLLCDINDLTQECFKNLTVMVEDETSLVLELKFSYIYFNVIEKDLKFILTYHKFDSKLIKRSETRMTFHNHSDLVSKVHNVVAYNISKKPVKYRELISCKRKSLSTQ